MRLTAAGPKRRRPLQLERLEDRTLLSTAVETIRGHATGTFVNVPLSLNPPAFMTTINGQGTAVGYGPVTALAHDTTTVTVRGKHATAVFSDGTGTLTDARGDEVFFTFTARGPFTSPTTFKTSGVAIITGGTGLFAHAKGRITAHGTGDVATGAFSLDLVARARY